MSFIFLLGMLLVVLVFSKWFAPTLVPFNTLHDFAESKVVQEHIHYVIVENTSAPAVTPMLLQLEPVMYVC